MTVGLVITYVSFNKNIEIINDYIICQDIENSKIELIKYFSNKIQNLNIDYPLEYEKLEYLVFNDNYINCNMINYKIFNNNTWSDPWDIQEIYDEVLELLLQKENEQEIDMNELYGEPNAEKLIAENHFSICSDLKYQKLEKEIVNILSKSEHINLKDEFAKNCSCEKCNNN